MTALRSTTLVPRAASDLASDSATRTIIDAVLAAWPEHERYIQKSFAARSGNEIRTTETLAKAALAISGIRLHDIAAAYRWTCDRLRDEELHFHRTGRYRLSTFVEADREVYSEIGYMRKYIDGLLLSQILWFNHAASCHFFLSNAPKLARPGSRYLEIGPGHGLMMYLALRDFALSSATAWDVSEVSIERTRAALSLLGFAGVSYAVQDIMAAPRDPQTFDLVVLSEILEHLEDPIAALRRVTTLLADDGLVFVNVPINSPSPDHIYLLQTPDDARRLLTEAGLTIVAESFFATQGTNLERALSNRVSVSACLFGRVGR